MIFFRECNQDILCICYTEVYDFLASGMMDGTVKMYKLNNSSNNNNNNEKFVLRDTEIIQMPSPVTAVKHRPVRKSYPISRTVIATCQCYTPQFLLFSLI
ncbi:uncharacterized protein LOC100867098 [Apis florea]|uniref:uncharacterized protein LOC100867098 n=1 Tax=Apis florea TaxID=7463 RepID=UPI0012FE8E91|nr:uncharacterized protein LOC100867098 [Apis florea]